MSDIAVRYFQDESRTLGPYEQTFKTQEEADAFAGTVYADKPTDTDVAEDDEAGEDAPLTDDANPDNGDGDKTVTDNNPFKGDTLS